MGSSSESRSLWVQLGFVGNERAALIAECFIIHCFCSFSIPFKLHRAKHLPVFSFIGSVAWAELTGQVAQPSVLPAISKIIPGTTRGKVASEFKVPEEPPNTRKAGVLLPIKEDPLQSNIGN